MKWAASSLKVPLWSASQRCSRSRSETLGPSLVGPKVAGISVIGPSSPAHLSLLMVVRWVETWMVQKKYLRI